MQDIAGRELKPFDLIYVCSGSYRWFTPGLFCGFSDNHTVQFMSLFRSNLLDYKLKGIKPSYTWVGKTVSYSPRIDYYITGKILKITEDMLDSNARDILNNYKKYIPDGDTRYSNI